MHRSLLLSKFKYLANAPKKLLTNILQKNEQTFRDEYDIN